MSEVLFELSVLGVKTAVYPDKIIKRMPMGAGEISIPIDNVASVEVGGFYSSTVTVVTTAGEKIDFMVIRKNKEAFKDAIYKAKEMQK